MDCFAFGFHLIGLLSGLGPVLNGLGYWFVFGALIGLGLIIGLDLEWVSIGVLHGFGLDYWS